ncbi:MAG: ABC transporter permease subunit [Ruminiclostridium sp.]|nr:ABC transporter permease subunit [Ruminiclostridium sp.]
MIAVFRHELSSYFTSLTGYVFGGFLLLFAGIYTMVYNLNALVANFEYVMESIAFIFLIIVPILTMRVLAEEKRQKTDQLLYSLPISMTQVVLGKFAALLVMFLLPLAILSLYPILLTAFGSVHLPAAFGAILGFFLLGSALLSIGMFLSSLTESQAVAAGLCFVVMLLNYFIVDLAGFVSSSAFGSLAAFLVVILLLALIVRSMTKSPLAGLVTGGILGLGTLAAYLMSSESFEGLFPKVMEQLSLFDRFYRFADGVFDLTALVYLLTVVGVFLFLSVQSMEKRRWSA